MSKGVIYIYIYIYIYIMDLYNVIIFCGGKCGGSTLNNTFNKNNYKSCHTHSNHYWINTLKNNDIFELIDCNSKNNKIYIIDSYRLPIERKISSFFQNIDVHVPDYKNKSIKQLIDFFNEKLLIYLEEYHPINEALLYYNLDMFNTFDYNKKYNILEHDNKVFIKILFRDVHNWDNILSEIFEKKIIIYPENLTSEKETYYLYKLFCENYKIPRLYIDDYLINDIEFKIYNTEEEQENYINKWLSLSY